MNLWGRLWLLRIQFLDPFISKAKNLHAVDLLFCENECPLNYISVPCVTFVCNNFEDL